MISRSFRFLALTLLLCVGVAVAQSDVPQMQSRVTPQSVIIGDPFTIEIDVECDKMQSVAFPEFDFDEQELIESVEPAWIDTLLAEGRRLKLRCSYKLRSFDEGIYNLGRVAVLYADKNIVDTLYSADSLRLEVLTYQIDSTSHAIFDLKPQRNTPFKVAEISGYLKWGALILLLVLLLVFVALKVLARYGKTIGGLFTPPPPVPPHVAAIKALEDLRNKKLWQSDKQKQYYSALTDILRTYISGRYSVAAMEMTTDEIIDAIKGLDIPQKCAMDLNALLRDADLVKFAKAAMESSENEEYYTKSYYFVEETKLVEESEEEEEDKGE